jgi:hypothetical protein
LVCSAIIRLSGESIEALRAFVTVLFSLSLLVEAFFAKELFTDMLGRRLAEKIGLVAALLSAVYPGSLAFTLTVYLEIFLLLLTLLGMLLVMLALRRRSTLLMVVSGGLFGLALFTKFVAVFPILSLILLLTIRKTVFDMPRRKTIASFMAGLAAVSLGSIAVVTEAWGALSQFLYQTLIFQAQLRPPFSLVDRLGTLSWYLDAFSPILVLAAFGGLILVSEFRNSRDIRAIFPIWMYALPLIFQLFVVGFWFHHLIYLTPLLFLVAGLSIADKSHLARARKEIGNRKVFTVALIAVVIYYSAIGISNPHRISPYVYSLDPSSYTRAERTVGSKVNELTNRGDAIWTSEGAIAFFADRLIVTPDSDEWPVAGFFDFWLGKTLGGNNGSGLVTPSEFEASWESQRPKVLIFIRNMGWVPYPDGLLWSGYENETGVDGYVLDHYTLHDTIQVEANPYSYEVWLRNG